MTEDRGGRFRDGDREAGFALILALMALMLLTFLGLTLATTTSTELQIATNYRWGQQAAYNAEAGLELTKRWLRTIPFELVLPAPRGPGNTAPPCPAGYSPSAGTQYCNIGPGLTPPPAVSARQGPSGDPNRNFENAECDTYWYEGYGAVLDIPNFPFAWQNVSQFLGQQLDGNFTVWVRRPLFVDPDGTARDDDSVRKMVVTVEGTAPYTASNDAFTQRRAVRYMEVTLQRNLDECEDPSQAGFSSTGSGYTCFRFGNRPPGGGPAQIDIQMQGAAGGAVDAGAAGIISASP